MEKHYLVIEYIFKHYFSVMPKIYLTSHGIKIHNSKTYNHDIICLYRKSHVIYSYAQFLIVITPFDTIIRKILQYGYFLYEWAPSKDDSKVTKLGKKKKRKG